MVQTLDFGSLTHETLFLNTQGLDESFLTYVLDEFMFQHPPLSLTQSELSICRAQATQAYGHPITIIIYPCKPRKQGKPHGNKALPQKWTCAHQNLMLLQTQVGVNLIRCLEVSSSWEKVDHAPKTCALILHQWMHMNLEALQNQIVMFHFL